MPHPSAYDPAIDDHVESPDPVDSTLTPQQLQALMTEFRDKLAEAHLAAPAKPDSKT